LQVLAIQKSSNYFDIVEERSQGPGHDYDKGIRKETGDRRVCTAVRVAESRSCCLHLEGRAKLARLPADS